MSAFHNLTGSNVVLWTEGVAVTLPPGRTDWSPPGAVGITNGVSIALAAPFRAWDEVILEGQDGGIHRVRQVDHSGEFWLGFALIVTCGLVVAAIRLARRALQHGNFTSDL